MADFDIIENKCVQNLFDNMEFKKPGQGEWYWRIPGMFRILDLQIIKSEIENGFRHVKENPI